MLKWAAKEKFGEGGPRLFLQAAVCYPESEVSKKVITHSAN